MSMVLFNQHASSGTNDADYVVVVIGIFAILVTAYWFRYRSVFQGPVSIFGFQQYLHGIPK